MPKDIYLYRKRNLFRILLFLSCFFLAFLFNACGNPQILLVLEGSKLLNLDDEGISLPVIVRIYQLTDKDEIEKADFGSLWKSEKEILGKELLDRKEITLQPNLKVEIKVEPLKEARYMAIMALFRKPEADYWRQIIPIRDSKVRSIEIKVHERRIELIKLK